MIAAFGETLFHLRVRKDAAGLNVGGGLPLAATAPLRSRP